MNPTTAYEIRLKGNIVLSIHSNSFKLVRGRTLLAVVLDEVSFWQDDSSSNPDTEVYKAVRPSLVRTGGLLVGISSPYRKVGLLHQKYKSSFGVDDDDVLVIQAATGQLNPTIDKAKINKEYIADPESAASEWGAAFRSDRAAFLDDQVIEDAIDYDRPLELAPRAGREIPLVVDTSAGKSDAYTCTIGHYEGEDWFADVVRGHAPPFDPRIVSQEYARLADEYNCPKIWGDSFAGEWVTATFNDLGKPYEQLGAARAPSTSKVCPPSIAAPSTSQILRSSSASSRLGAAHA